MSNYKPPFILASASPRRRQLLAKAGYTFKVCAADIDESTFSAAGLDPRQYAEKLALAKAKNVAVKYPDSLVIGADTLIDFDGEIIGKAANPDNARQIVSKLFSKPHKVITALAIIRLADKTQMLQSQVTVIYPKKMTEEQIESHIQNNSWQGKAGAYAIQENGDEFVQRIEGSLTNVIGMPMRLLNRMLAALTDTELPS